MKAVVDTNILISGIFWKGPPAEIIKAWLDQRFQIVVSSDILQEYHDTLAVLEAKYSAPIDARALLNGISLNAEIITPATLERVVCTDPDDDKFLAAAMSGAAVVVSGDKALLKTSGYQGIAVMKASEFLRKIKRSDSK